jgi:hypothetical protein
MEALNFLITTASAFLQLTISRNVSYTKAVSMGGGRMCSQAGTSELDRPERIAAADTLVLCEPHTTLKRREHLRSEMRCAYALSPSWACIVFAVAVELPER